MHCGSRNLDINHTFTKVSVEVILEAFELRSRKSNVTRN